MDLDVKTVLEKLQSASTRWYYIGLQLKIPVNTLDCIKDQYADPTDCLREMIERWLKQINPRPTWRALVNALRAQSVGEGRLALELKVQYCHMEGTTKSDSEAENGVIAGKVEGHMSCLGIH